MEDNRMMDAIIRADSSRRLLYTDKNFTGSFNWEWDLQTGMLHWSEGIYSIAGLLPEVEVRPDLIENIIHPEDRNWLHKLIASLKRQPQAIEIQIRIVRPTKEIRICLVSGKPEIDESGDFVKMTGHVMDVTEVIQLRESLIQSELLFRTVFDHSEIGMALVARDGSYKKVNQSLCHILGYDQEELLKIKFSDITCAEDLETDLKVVQELLSGQRITNHRDKRYYHKNGEVIWASVRVSSVRDQHNNFLYFISQVEDITERKRVDLALHKSEEEYKSLFEQNPEAVFLLNIHGKFVHINNAALLLFGYSEESLLEKYFGDLCSSENRSQVDQLFTKAHRGDRHNFTLTIITGKGKKIYISITSMPIVLDGAVAGIYVIARDVTEKRQLEKIIKREQERFSEMFAEAPVAMCILKGEDHVFEKANGLYYKLSGRHDILGKTVREVFPEAEGQGIFELLDHVYKTGETYTVKERLVRLDLEGNGKLTDLYLDFMYQPYKNSEGEVKGIFFFGVDMTEQVLSRKKIEQSEERFRVIFEQAAVGVAIRESKTGKLIRINKKYSEIFGYTREELTQMTFREFTHPDDLQKNLLNIQSLMKGEINEFSMEKRHFHKDGSIVWVNLTVSPMWKKGEQPTNHIAIVQDITERKKAEEEVTMLSLIAKKTINAVIITNPDGEIEWANKAFSHITEFEHHEVIGKRTENFLYGEKTDQATIQFIKNRKRDQQPFECEILKYTKSGKPFWVEMQGLPLMDSTGTLTHYFNIETDITEKKNAYEKLAQTESELRSFAKELNNALEDERSRIAREIHDEFGQQLTGLKMSLSSLNEIAGLDSTSKETINEMMKGVENTIESLRNFSTELRPGILDTLGLIPSIEWLAKGFEKKTGIKCSLTFKVKQSVFEKNFSTAYFRICQEALTNITKHSEANKVSIKALQHDGELSLTITDNGKGIPREIMKNPFSMGLLGMRERARLIGARLNVISNENSGTSIQVTGKLYA